MSWGWVIFLIVWAVAFPILLSPDPTKEEESAMIERREKAYAKMKQRFGALKQFAAKYWWIGMMLVTAELGVVIAAGYGVWSWISQ